MKLKNQLLIVVFFVFTSCMKNPEQNTKPVFYDIANFFKKEASGLTKLKKPIYKEVIKDGISEKKTISINNWDTEFQLFAQSDINKPAWKNSYRIEKTNNKLVYTATDNDLKTRFISIVFKNNKVQEIKIVNKSSNLLYTSDENLTYTPGIEYKIIKHTKVVLLGKDDYTITGSFLN